MIDQQGVLLRTIPQTAALAGRLSRVLRLAEPRAPPGCTSGAAGAPRVPVVQPSVSQAQPSVSQAQPQDLLGLVDHRGLEIVNGVCEAVSSSCGQVLGLDLRIG